MTQILTKMSNKENPLNETMADGVADAENAHKERSPPKEGNNAPEETTLFLGEGEMMEHDHCGLFKKMSENVEWFCGMLQGGKLC